jgi:hypothetical protein
VGPTHPSNPSRPAMKKALFLAMSALALAVPTSAATVDAEITPDRFGSFRISETTLREAKRTLGEPTKIERIGQGCWDRMKILKWGPDLRILFIYSGGHHVVHTPRTKARIIDVAGGDRWRMVTGRGLEIGDSKRRLLDLYPNAKNHGTRTYTLLVRDGYKYQTATLDRSDRVVALAASHSC